MLWFNPGRHLNALQSLITHLRWDGKQSEREKYENCWVDIKTVYQVKQNFHSFTTSQGLATSWKVGLILHNAFLGEQTPSLCTCPSTSFSPAFIADVTQHGISLWPVWVHCPGSVHSPFCPPSSSLAWQCEKQNGPWLRASTALQQLKHSCSYQISNAASREPLQRKLTVSQQKTTTNNNKKPHNINYLLYLIWKNKIESITYWALNREEKLSQGQPSQWWFQTYSLIFM